VPVTVSSKFTFGNDVFTLLMFFGDVMLHTGAST